LVRRNDLKTSELRDHIVAALEDMKGVNIVTLDVAALTPMTDYMVMVTGTSNRHVKALVDTANESAKAIGVQPLGIEGRESYDWVLVDLADVIVHVMKRLREQRCSTLRSASAQKLTANG
jgi:ribosome-associated protein